MKCFEAHEKFSSCCEKQTCRYWINFNTSQNCTLLASKSGPMTLQEIGDIFGVTRMRICQQEKRIIQKMENLMSKKID